MPDFNSLFQNLQSTVTSAVAQQAGQYAQQVGADVNDFLNQSKSDLQLWTTQLAAGQMSQDDFAFLMRGKASVAEMNAITAAGMAAIDVDRLRNALIQGVINAVFQTIQKV